MSSYDRPTHRVYMTFFYRGAWQVQFCEVDLKTPLPRQFTFTDPEKIRELARRREAWGDSDSQQMLEHAIENGRGGCFLRLTPEQYRALGRPIDWRSPPRGISLVFGSARVPRCRMTTPIA